MLQMRSSGVHNVSLLDVSKGRDGSLKHSQRERERGGQEDGEGRMGGGGQEGGEIK